MFADEQSKNECWPPLERKEREREERIKSLVSRRIGRKSQSNELLLILSSLQSFNFVYPISSVKIGNFVLFFKGKREALWTPITLVISIIFRMFEEYFLCPMQQHIESQLC
jgi:hypothetical protein